MTEKVQDVKQRAATQQEAEPQAKMIQIDPVTMLRIQLLATEKRLAVEEERSTMLILKEIRKRKTELDRQEQVLLAAVKEKVGVGAGESLRLVDQEKGLCSVES